MLKHWLLELIGHTSGLSEAQLQQIEKALPRTTALIDLLKKAQTDHRTGAQPVR
jgi:hypothetical protein